MSNGKKVVMTIQDPDKNKLRNSTAYLFDQSGKLVEKHGLEKGKVSFKSSEIIFRKKLTLLIGPKLPEEVQEQEITLNRLKKLGGFQPSKLIDRGGRFLIPRLPKWPDLPLFKPCLITGNVNKDFLVNNDLVNQPICDARVHICEVDPIHIFKPRIPDYVIDDLLERLKHKLYPIPKPVLPDPPILNPRIPRIDPRVFRDITRPRIPLINRDFIKPIIKPSLVKESMIRTDIQLSTKVQRQLFLSSKSVSRKAVLDNLPILRPYICLWPYFWPYFYKCDHIATVYTDCEGNFDHQYWNFNNDRDIYVWVEVNINGEWVTVYKPHKACGTYWNYDCGQEISIKVSDPRIPPCDCEDDEIEGDIVWFRSIGNSVKALDIEQNDSNTITVQGASIRNVGCTDHVSHEKMNPFAMNLPFVLTFGNGFPTSTITHYRWKKKQLKDAVLSDVSDTAQIVNDNTITRPYEIITQVDGIWRIQVKPSVIGPVGSGEHIAYRIPAYDAVNDDGISAIDKTMSPRWSRRFFTSLNVDSLSLDDGLWEFQLELGSYNESSGVFTPITVDKDVFHVTDNGPLPSGVTIQSTPAPDMLLENVSSTEASYMKIKLRIDNSPCEAEIYDTEIPIPGSNSLVSGPCGFINYTSRSQGVKLSFEASHPRNFAKFSYRVVKGNGTNNPPNMNVNGAYVISSFGSYNLIAGDYERIVSVNHLLGSCNQASFAERLVVTSLATNGTRRIHEYDRSDLESFALAE